MNRKFTKRGQIWYVDLENNIGSEQNGIRPCIVLQRQQKNENTCIILPASRTKRISTIHIDEYTFLLHQVRAVDTSRLIKKVKRIEKKVVDSLCDSLNIFLKQ